MPPFVYRSLKDYMRTATMGSARQELLKKLLAQAAQRKTQLHIDASGARMSTFPEMFGQSLAKNMGKQAFLGAGLNMAGRGIVNFARNQLQGGLGKAVGNMGNAVRGMGIQAGRAGQRIGTAAQPLVNELKDMGGQIVNRAASTPLAKQLKDAGGEIMNHGAETVKNLPAWALPAAGGAAVGAAGMHDYLTLRDLGQSRLPQTMPQMPGGFNNRPKFETLPYKLPRPNGIIPGGMHMPQYQKHRADGFDIPRWGGYGQGGVAGSDNPYSMSLAKAGAYKQANMALLKQMLSPALKRLQSYGANAIAGAGRVGSRYLDLMEAKTLKNIVNQHGLATEMRSAVSPYSTEALKALQAAGGSGFSGDLATHLDDMARGLQHKGLGEAAKVIGARTGTVGAGFLGGSAAYRSAVGNEKTSGLMDEVLRRAASGVKGVVTGHGGELLEAMTPKAQGFKRYLEMLKFQRANAMRDNAEKLIALHPNASDEFVEQMMTAYRPEAYKSLGTVAGTGAGGMLGLNALFSGNQQAPAMKQSAANAGSPMSFAIPAAAVGAIGGGLTGAVMGPRKKKLRAILKGLVSGGLTGAGAGVGLSVGGELGGRAGYAIPGGSFFDKLQRGNIGAHAGAPLGAVGGGALGALLADRLNAMTDATIDGDEEKYSAEMPEPSSRGQTKKVTMPEASEQDPDCDPEGADMTEKDHDVKAAVAAGKLLPRAKYSTDKQAFMGPGAIAGLLTAPKGQSDLSVGRGALRGLGTGLGVGTGAVTGSLLGGGGGAITGGLVAALAAALSGRKGRSFNNAVGQGISAGGGLGLLAGGVGGAAYGGYKGNKATKALLDKTAPIDENEDDDDDDKDVKKSAAVVMAQLKKNQKLAMDDNAGQQPYFSGDYFSRAAGNVGQFIGAGVGSVVDTAVSPITNTVNAGIRAGQNVVTGAKNFYNWGTRPLNQSYPEVFKPKPPKPNPQWEAQRQNFEGSMF